MSKKDILGVVFATLAMAGIFGLVGAVILNEFKSIQASKPTKVVKYTCLKDNGQWCTDFETRESYIKERE